MRRVGGVLRPRLWVGIALGIAVAAGSDALAPAHAAAPAEAPELAADAACELSPRRATQVVVCTMRGMAPGGPVAIRVVGDGGDASTEAVVGGATVADDGTARVAADVPCGMVGSTTVEVTAPSADGSRFRHVTPVELVGRCRAAWQLTAGEWATVLAAALCVAAAIVVAGRLRRRRRRRRRRRAVSAGSPGRPRTRAPSDAGRRRSPRRRRRRRRR